MERIENHDGTWTIIFDSPGEAIDDCDLGRYADSEYFTRVRDEVRYFIRFVNDGLSSSKLTETVGPPYLRGNCMIYVVRSKDDYKERTIGVTLRQSGTAFVAYKTIRAVYRKLVNSEPDDPKGSVRYIYKYGEESQHGISF